MSRREPPSLDDVPRLPEMRREWRAFAVGLGDTLAELADDTFLIVDLPADVGYVQFVRTATGGLRVETQSNHYRSEPHDLSDAAIAELISLGWSGPTHDAVSEAHGQGRPTGSSNFYRVWPRPIPYDDVALFVVRTVRDILTVARPTDLRYTAFTQAGEGVVFDALGIPARDEETAASDGDVHEYGPDDHHADEGHPHSGANGNSHLPSAGASSRPGHGNGNGHHNGNGHAAPSNGRGARPGVTNGNGTGHGAGTGAGTSNGNGHGLGAAAGASSGTGHGPPAGHGARDGALPETPPIVDSPFFSQAHFDGRDALLPVHRIPMQISGTPWSVFEDILAPFHTIERDAARGFNITDVIGVARDALEALRIVEVIPAGDGTRLVFRAFDEAFGLIPARRGPFIELSAPALVEVDVDRPELSSAVATIGPMLPIGRVEPDHHGGVSLVTQVCADPFIALHLWHAVILMTATLPPLRDAIVAAQQTMSKEQRRRDHEGARRARPGRRRQE